MPFLSAIKNKEFTLFLNPILNDKDNSILEADLDAFLDVTRRYRVTKLHVVQREPSNLVRWEMIALAIKKHKRITQIDFVWNLNASEGGDNPKDVMTFFECLLTHDVRVPVLNLKHRSLPMCGDRTTAFMKYCALPEVTDLTFTRCAFSFVENTNDSLRFFLSSLTNKKTMIMIECGITAHTLEFVDFRPFLTNNVDTLTTVHFSNNFFCCIPQFKNIMEMTKIESYVYQRLGHTSPLFNEPATSLSIMCSKLHTLRLTTYSTQDDIIGLASIINAPSLAALRTLELVNTNWRTETNNVIVDPLLEALITNTSLTSLYIHDQKIVIRDARVFFHLLTTNDTLVLLDLFKRPFNSTLRIPILTATISAGIIQSLAKNVALRYCSLPFVLSTPTIQDVHRFSENTTLMSFEVVGHNGTVSVIPQIQPIITRNSIVAPSLFERLFHWVNKTDLNRVRPAGKRQRVYAPAGQLPATRQRTS